MGAEFVITHAPDLVFLDDFAKDAGDFALDSLRGKLALDEGEKLLERCVALAVLKLRFREIFEALADFRPERFESFARLDFFREGVVERRKLLRVDAVKGGRIADFGTAKIRERKIRGNIERERALLVDRHSLKGLGKSRDQRSLIHENPGIPAALKLRGCLRERFRQKLVADFSLVSHNRIIAHGESASLHGFERRVRIAELFQPFLHVLLDDLLLGKLDGDRRIIRQLKFRSRDDARPIAHGLVLADLHVLDFGHRQHAEIFLLDRLVDALAQKLFFQLFADVFRKPRVDQRLRGFAGAVSGDPGLALKIFGNGLPFTRHLVGGKLDLKVDDTIGLRITNDIHGQSIIGAQEFPSGNREPKKVSNSDWLLTACRSG